AGAEVYLTSVAFGEGTFVAVGASGAILTSIDGVRWTHRDLGTIDNLEAVTHGKGTFVAVGPYGAIVQSEPLVETAPALAAEPASQMVPPGATVSFSATSVGT